MGGGVGEGIGPLLHVPLVVPQHQRPGAVGHAAGEHAATGGLGQVGQGRPGPGPGLVLQREGDVDDHIAVRGQVHAHLAHLAHQLLVLEAVPLLGEQRGQQLFPQELVAGHHVPPQALHVLLGAALGGDLPGHPGQRLAQLLGRDGLEQVFLHAQGDGLLGIGEVVVAGENHDAHPGHHPLHLRAQLHAVHEGHADVRQQDVRV